MMEYKNKFLFAYDTQTEGILTQLNRESNKNKYTEVLAVGGDDYLKYGIQHDKILLILP